MADLVMHYPSPTRRSVQKHRTQLLDGASNALKPVKVYFGDRKALRNNRDYGPIRVFKGFK